MILALDYDGTYTKDPLMWDEFIRLAQRANHQVICCTMRHEEEGDDVRSSLKWKVNQIIYTGRAAKKPFLELLNIKIDIWIDDNPHWILQDSQ